MISRPRSPSGPRLALARIRRAAAPALATVGFALLALPDAGATPIRGDDEDAPKRISMGLQLRGHLGDHDSYSGIWGYTSPDGREYALLGTSDGTSVVNIVDRANPREVGFIPGPTSPWREIKTFRHFMYVVTEGGGGLQIVNLDDPENPRPVTTYLGFDRAHNITIEPRNFCAYICGANREEGGVRILWLGDPRSPQLIGTWEEHYAHDVHVRGNIMYVSAIQTAALYIVNIRDVRHPKVLSVIGNYPQAYTHNAWTTADGRYVLTTDEVPGASTRVWDISDPKAPTSAGLYRPADAPSSPPHNVFVDGHLAYIAHYTAGIRVVDISDPYDPIEVAYFDTLPTSDSGSFDGCWGAYPYYKRSPGLFVASDITHGLFVLEMEGQLADLERDGGVEEREMGGSIAHEAGPADAAAAAKLTVHSFGPNPMNARGETTFEVRTPTPAATSALVFDASGRLVRRLFEGRSATERSSFTWDARDARGRAVAAGSYWLLVQSGDLRETQRLVVLR